MTHSHRNQPLVQPHHNIRSNHSTKPHKLLLPFHPGQSAFLCMGCTYRPMTGIAGLRTSGIHLNRRTIENHFEVPGIESPAGLSVVCITSPFLSLLPG